MHLFFLPKFYRDLKKVLAIEFVTDYNPSVIIILLFNVQKNVYWEWRISMKKIVIGGQIDKNEVKDLVEKFSEGQFEIDIKSDLDAAMAVKSGQADYYVGACNTGGGGALAMALALLGRENCVTVSMPGNVMPEAEIRENVQSGKTAFGFTAQHKETVIPIIMDELKKTII